MFCVTGLVCSPFTSLVFNRLKQTRHAHMSLFSTRNQAWLAIPQSVSDKVTSYWCQFAERLLRQNRSGSLNTVKMGQRQAVLQGKDDYTSLVVKTACVYVGFRQLLKTEN